MAEEKRQAEADVTIAETLSDADERELAALGKKSVLRVLHHPLS